VANRSLVDYDPGELSRNPAWEEGRRMPVADLVRYALGQPATV
jgi:hypothetical protein